MVLKLGPLRSNSYSKMSDLDGGDYLMNETTSYELNEYSRATTRGGQQLNDINSNWSSHSEYEDKFIKIDSKEIELKNYYFPTGSSKFIPIREVVSVETPEKMGVPWWDVMIWGRGLSNIWWAKDSGRDQGKCQNTVCFRQRGEKCVKACSTLDRHRVLSLIDYLLNNH